MTHSELVDNVNGASGGSTVDYSSDKTDSHYSKHEQNSSVSRSVDSGGMSVIRKSLENRGISEDSADIIMASWQDSTKKQYTVYTVENGFCSVVKNKGPLTVVMGAIMYSCLKF